MVAGRKVNGAQIKELHRHLNERSSLTYAAMKAGMDRKTARGYLKRGHGPSTQDHRGIGRPMWMRLLPSGRR